ncbi:winged helix-turn-helix transcriptional regulator [Cohnella abietis]|uniref:Transcriptional regulator n=1 Tax=Cohnella abietis TaxID=2507935 RepID=A0A3T1D827_9BACL|nr:helix-turn-helix domain-containing protein [Cohnella abietis]BBI34236.1 transcriptional regulator [Cohnella abietis]
MNTLIEEKRNNHVCEVLQVLGSKWGFAIISELYTSPRRFNQLQRELAPIHTQSLTDTLRLLEQTKLVQRQVFPTVPVSVEYSLTEKGNDFQTVIKEMNNYAIKWDTQR